MVFKKNFLENLINLTLKRLSNGVQGCELGIFPTDVFKNSCHCGVIVVSLWDLLATDNLYQVTIQVNK